LKITKAFVKLKYKFRAIVNE